MGGVSQQWDLAEDSASTMIGTTYTDNRGGVYAALDRGILRCSATLCSQIVALVTDADPINVDVALYPCYSSKQ